MKKISIIPLILLIVMLISPVAVSIDAPLATTDFYVDDYAGVISESTKQLIMKDSVAIQKSTGAQIVVVTVDTIGNNVLEDYSLNILRTWGIGDKQKNNGVLLLVAVNDHVSRIEVGYGLEGALPDGKTGRIQDNYMLPYFKTGNYDEGIKNGYLAILKEVENEYSIDSSVIDNTQPQAPATTVSDIFGVPINIIFGILIILLFLIDWIFWHGSLTRLLILLTFSRGGRGGFGGGGFMGGGGSGGGGGSSRRW